MKQLKAIIPALNVKSGVDVAAPNYISALRVKSGVDVATPDYKDFSIFTGNMDYRRQWLPQCVIGRQVPGVVHLAAKDKGKSKTNQGQINSTSVGGSVACQCDDTTGQIKSTSVGGSVACQCDDTTGQINSTSMGRIGSTLLGRIGSTSIGRIGILPYLLILLLFSSSLCAETFAAQGFEQTAADTWSYTPNSLSSGYWGLMDGMFGVAEPHSIGQAGIWQAAKASCFLRTSPCPWAISTASAFITTPGCLAHRLNTAVTAYLTTMAAPGARG